MTTFTATVSSAATVDASVDAIWAVLTDPEKLSRLTPLLERVEADGDTWVWQMLHISGLGVGITPHFTEHMTFDPGRRIAFHHAPPAGTRERVGVEGFYALDPDGAQTHLAITTTVEVDLPLPRVARPAVTRFMQATMQRIGERFGANLMAELDA